MPPADKSVKQPTSEPVHKGVPDLQGLATPSDVPNEVQSKVWIDSIRDLGDNQLEIKGTIQGLYPAEAYYNHWEPDQLEKFVLKDAVLDENEHVVEEEESEMRPKEGEVPDRRLMDGAELNTLTFQVHTPPSFEDYGPEHRDDLLRWAKGVLYSNAMPTEQASPVSAPEPVDLGISG